MEAQLAADVSTRLETRVDAAADVDEYATPPVKHSATSAALATPRRVAWGAPVLGRSVPASSSIVSQVKAILVLGCFTRRMLV